jgi:hypothetical protein
MNFPLTIILSVQVEAGRIITRLRINSSKSKLYEELGWEPLYKRREKLKLIPNLTQSNIFLLQVRI